jgi:hypothetical protein
VKQQCDVTTAQDAEQLLRNFALGAPPKGLQ